MWWRAIVMIGLLVGLGAGAFFGTGPLMRTAWEDHVLLQLRDQSSFKPQESPVLDVPAHSVPVARSNSPAPSVETGRRLFQLKCVFCHGEAGQGDGPVGKKFVVKVGDLGSAPVQTQSDDQLFQTISQGKRVMRTFGNELDEAEIRSLVQFLRTLK